jgi:hypothetical protein
MQRLKLGMLLALFASAAATAQAVSITSSPSDFEPRFNYSTNTFAPGPSTMAATLRSGFQANFNITSAFFFPLPVLAPGEVITGADFTVTEMPDTAAGALTPQFNADLYALGVTNTNPPANGTPESQAYYFIGNGPAPVGQVMIQDNFLLGTDFIPLGGTAATKSTSATGDTALLTYINSLYQNPLAAGFIPGTSNLILRVNPDVGAAGGTQRFTFAAAENTTQGIVLPTLTLTTTIVPEPGSIAMLAVGMAGLGLAAWRRRK